MPRISRAVAGPILITFFAFPIGCASPEPAVESAEPALTEGASSSSSGSNAAAQYPLTISGEGFEASAGKMIAVSALRRGVASGPSGTVGPRLTLTLTDLVDKDGRFDLSCASCLPENQSYPSWGLWLDENGDGKCGTGDRVMRRQLYAWWGDEARVTAAGSDSAEKWLSPEDLSPSSVPFCEYYNFPR